MLFIVKFIKWFLALALSAQVVQEEPPCQVLTEWEQTYIIELNNLRKERGVPPLSWFSTDEIEKVENERLTLIYDQWKKWEETMDTKQLHNGKITSGENATGFWEDPTPEMVINKFKNHPPHCYTQVKSKYTKVYAVVRPVKTKWGILYTCYEFYE